MEHSSIILSILICSLEERQEQFSFLYSKLYHQINDNNLDSCIEVLHETDNGQMPVGQKRNLLLSRAKGDYICFVDDDDDITDDYITSIIDALKTKPDCIGIIGLLRTKKVDIPFKHSIQFQDWYTGTDAFYRTPNHLNPIKRNIACKVGFPFQNNGEDHYYSKGLKTRLKTEVYIDHPIYIYNKKELIA